ncbi:acyltransferase family protein [Streptomyces sp. NPDC058691]|uniref:acyltransferase family protein n=1 Tax=Streptomyces sp. NPDC058691 TaxID=3346601 RepID=UPI003665D2AC
MTPTQQPAAEPAPAVIAGSGRTRDAFFDNAKFLAIVLVVVGHVWEPLIEDSRALKAAYMFVYAFHMPAFIIISGYFSRNFDWSAGRLRRLVTGVVVPYVVFETLYSLFKRYAGGDADQPISLLDPWFLTWFLIALFIWRLMVPLWKLVPWPVPVSLAIAVFSLAAQIGPDLSLSRVLQLMPFFVIGMNLRPGHFALVRRRAVRIAAAPLAVVAAGAVYWAEPHVKAKWLYHRMSADQLGVSFGESVLITLGTVGAALVLTVLFFALVPGRRTWFTSMGETTLYVFLLHGFFIKGAIFAGFYDTGFAHSHRGFVVMGLLAVAMATVLATPPVRLVFRALVEPRMDWAFKRRPGPTSTVLR